MRDRPAAEPTGSASPKFGDNLVRRIVTSVVALPIVLAALFLGPPQLVVALTAVVVVLGLREVFALLETRGLRPMKLTGLALTALIFLEETHPGWSSAPLWPALGIALFVAALRREGDLAQAVPSAAVTLLGATYLGALGGTLAGLRLLEPESEGVWRLALLLTVIVFSDTTAFFVGHGLGRHQLAPRISPRKTVEGALGALLGGVLGALAVRWLGFPQLSLPTTVVLGALVATMGMVGDLFESLLKRWAGVKDSGGLFPGHGGVLDRIDGLLFGAPVLYYYFFYLR